MAEVEAAAFLTQPRPGALLRFVRVMTHWPILPGIILTVLVVAAVFAPLLTSYPPLKHNLRERNLPPGWYAQGTWSHPFGTDIIGRDVLSRLMYGAHRAEPRYGRVQAHATQPPCCRRDALQRTPSIPPQSGLEPNLESCGCLAGGDCHACSSVAGPAFNSPSACRST